MNRISDPFASEAHMSGMIWPNDLAAIRELHWRAVRLTETRNPGNMSRWKSHKDAGVRVRTRRFHHTFSDTDRFEVTVDADGRTVYDGDGINHRTFNLTLIRVVLDKLRRILVLDDLGDLK